MESHFSSGEKISWKTKTFCDLTTVLNERKHLKIVFRSVPNSVILFLDRSDRSGLTALIRSLQFEIEVGEGSVQKLVALADIDQTTFDLTLETCRIQ